MRNRVALAAMLVLAVACGGKEEESTAVPSAEAAEYGGVEVRILRAGDGRSVEAGGDGQGHAVQKVAPGDRHG